MTAIAWDGKTLAADTQQWRGNMRYGEVSKITKLKDGSYFAASGNSCDGHAFEKWWNDGKDEKKKPNLESFSAILIYPSGMAVEYYEDLVETPAPKFASQGCGMNICLAVMATGGDAVKAVQTAIDLYSHCGGKVESVVID